MSALDDHNRQHTIGNSLGPTTSVVGVSAQQAIDANKRGLGESTRSDTATAPLRWKDHMKLALGGLLIAALAAIAAYIVGGIGAVALSVIAFLSGVFGASFLIAALISAMTSRSA